MNTWQALRQIKELLEAATWPDAGGEVVFGQVVTTAGFSRANRPAIRYPLAVVTPAGMKADEAMEGLEDQAFEVAVWQKVEGDPYGESALTGGARAGGAISSDGRGLCEIEEQLKAELGKIAGANGVHLRVDAAGAAGSEEDPEDGYLAYRSYSFTGWLTAQRTYPPARSLRAEDGGGQADLTWRLPPDRFDRLSVVIRRAEGSTAPADVSSGTDVPVGGLVSSVEDTGLASGTYSYALFMGYDETEAGVADRYSSAITVTVEVA